MADPKNAGTGWLGKLLGFGGAPVREGSFAQTSNEENAVQPYIAGPRPGDVVTGRYGWRLDRRLGEGASGAVYLARRADSTEEAPMEAAVKLLSTGHRHDAYLRRELSAMLAMTTDRIPRVYDWALEGDRPFVAMQFFPEGSLRDALVTVGALEEESVWRLLTDLLTAIRDAHQASVLHLDIKPANVLLDGKGGFVLTDFGISQGNRIAAGAIPTWGAGTRGYQAPEQRWLDPARFDMRTDLFAVGSTVWSAWTGINLASKRSVPLMAKKADEKYGLPSPSEFRHYASPELKAVVMSLLLQEQTDRPGSAGEVLARVERARGQNSGAGSSLGEAVPAADARNVITHLMDPLWAHLFGQTDGAGMQRFRDGDVLAREGERAHHTWILLRGAVRIVQDGVELATEAREGVFLGEVATLTGQRRTATVCAVGDVFVYPLNAAQLEWLVTSNPAVGIRLIRSMAERLSRQS